MKLDRRDWFILSGLLALVTGISAQFSPGWGAIVGGAILMVFGAFGR